MVRPVTTSTQGLLVAHGSDRGAGKIAKLINLECSTGGAVALMRAGAVVLALTLGAAKAEPITLIDHEWNVRYAKFACEKARVETTPEILPSLSICLRDE